MAFPGIYLLKSLLPVPTAVTGTIAACSQLFLISDLQQNITHGPHVTWFGFRIRIVLIIEGCFCYCWVELTQGEDLFCYSLHPTSGWAGGAQEGGGDPAAQRDIPHHMTPCSAYKAGGKLARGCCLRTGWVLATNCSVHSLFCIFFHHYYYYYFLLLFCRIRLSLSQSTSFIFFFPIVIPILQRAVWCLAVCWVKAQRWATGSVKDNFLLPCTSEQEGEKYRRRKCLNNI